jgi:ribosomal protein L32E
MPSGTPGLSPDLGLEPVIVENRHGIAALANDEQPPLISVARNVGVEDDAGDRSQQLPFAVSP